jgi:hypothetical protein
MVLNKNESIFTTAGVVYGLLSSYKKGGDTKKIITSVAIYGAAGYLVGMAITKFYER